MVRKYRGQAGPERGPRGFGKKGAQRIQKRAGGAFFGAQSFAKNSARASINGRVKTGVADGGEGKHDLARFAAMSFRSIDFNSLRSTAIGCDWVRFEGVAATVFRVIPRGVKWAGCPQREILFTVTGCE